MARAADSQSSCGQPVAGTDQVIAMDLRPRTGRRRLSPAGCAFWLHLVECLPHTSPWSQSRGCGPGPQPDGPGTGLWPHRWGPRGSRVPGPGQPWGVCGGEGRPEGRGPGPRGQKLSGQWDQRSPADAGLLGRALGSGLAPRARCPPTRKGMGEWLCPRVSTVVLGLPGRRGAHFLARKAGPRWACRCRCTSWSSCSFRLATCGQGASSGGAGAPSQGPWSSDRKGCRPQSTAPGGGVRGTVTSGRQTGTHRAIIGDSTPGGLGLHSHGGRAEPLCSGPERTQESKERNALACGFSRRGSVGQGR